MQLCIFSLFCAIKYGQKHLVQRIGWVTNWKIESPLKLLVRQLKFCENQCGNVIFSKELWFYKIKITFVISDNFKN